MMKYFVVALPLISALRMAPTAEFLDGVSLESSIASAENWGPDYLQYYSPANTERQQGFMFCMIPKVATTEFIALMMRMEGLNKTLDNGRAQYNQAHMVQFDGDCNRMMFKRSNVADQTRFNAIMDPENRADVRAVFLRDPIDRFVSAYLSKIKAGVQYLIKRYPANSASEMIAMLEKEPIHEADPHFRSQSSLCNLQGAQYDFKGSFDHLNEDAHSMLKMLAGDDFAEKMIDNGWGSEAKQSLFGENRVDNNHATNAHSKREGVLSLMELDSELHEGVEGTPSLHLSVKSVQEFNTQKNEIVENPELLRRLKILYAEDIKQWESL